MQVSTHAWNYGRHLGLAFQVVDDILDLTASSSMLGKPALNDLRSGIATAPVRALGQGDGRVYHRVSMQACTHIRCVMPLLGRPASVS